MKILVTGAAGQLGSALLRALASRTDTTEIVAVDQHPLATDSPKLRVLTGDLTAPGFARGLVDRGTATVFHLASLVSGGAEQDFELGTRVNLDATRELLEACRIAGHAPRFVFTSSIAVYGGTLPDPVTDDTPTLPRLSYGAQKLACEILINDYTRRGFLVGATLRLPAVLVRGGGPNSAVSGWTSALIREPLAGRDYVCPVAARTRQPCISARRAVESLIAASRLDPGALGHDRSVLLTGVTATAGEMYEAARRAAGGAPFGRVEFRPDERIQAVMDGVPQATRSRRAARLGFAPSRDIDEIVAEYVADHLSVPTPERP